MKNSKLLFKILNRYIFVGCRKIVINNNIEGENVLFVGMRVGFFCRLFVMIYDILVVIVVGMCVVMVMIVMLVVMLKNGVLDL